MDDVNSNKGLTAEDVQAITRFANEFPGVVFVFDKAIELLMQQGVGTNLVPGTATAAYVDNDHLSTEGRSSTRALLCFHRVSLLLTHCLNHSLLPLSSLQVQNTSHPISVQYSSNTASSRQSMMMQREHKSPLNGDLRWLRPCLATH